MSPPPSLTNEHAILELARQRPLIRARDLAAHALPTMVLSRLVSSGKLKRVARGVYSLPERKIHEHSSLAEACLRVPQGVICLLSALRVHGVGSQAPFEVWMALPHNLPAPRLDQPSLRVVRMSGPSFTEGVEARLIDGIAVPIFNLEKTVVDCFKFRNKIGIDVAIEALRESWSGRKVSMDAIWHYANIDRVANVIRPYLESVTA